MNDLNQPPLKVLSQLVGRTSQTATLVFTVKSRLVPTIELGRRAFQCGRTAEVEVLSQDFCSITGEQYTPGKICDYFDTRVFGKGTHKPRSIAIDLIRQARPDLDEDTILTYIKPSYHAKRARDKNVRPIAADSNQANAYPDIGRDVSSLLSRSSVQGPELPATSGPLGGGSAELESHGSDTFTKEIMALRAEGNTFEEIASRLGTSLSTVLRRIHKAFPNTPMKRFFKPKVDYTEHPRCNAGEVVRQRNENRTFREIADRMGVSLDTVRRVYFAATLGPSWISAYRESQRRTPRTKKQQAGFPEQDQILSQIMEIRSQKVSFKEVAQRLGLPYEFVLKRFRQAYPQETIRLFGRKVDYRNHQHCKADAVLKLWHENKTFREIGRELGCSEETARKVFHAVRPGTSLRKHGPRPHIDYLHYPGCDAEEVVRLKETNQSFAEIGAIMGVPKWLVRKVYHAKRPGMIKHQHRQKRVDYRNHPRAKVKDVLRLRAQGMTLADIGRELKVSTTVVVKVLRASVSADHAK